MTGCNKVSAMEEVSQVKVITDSDIVRLINGSYVIQQIERESLPDGHGQKYVALIMPAFEYEKKVQNWNTKQLESWQEARRQATIRGHEPPEMFQPSDTLPLEAAYRDPRCCAAKV